MFILVNVLHIFLVMLVKRICLNICFSDHILILITCIGLNQLYCKKKLDAGRYWNLKGLVKLGKGNI